MKIPELSFIFINDLCHERKQDKDKRTKPQTSEMCDLPQQTVIPVNMCED